MSDYDYAKYQRDRLEAARRYDAEQSKASLTGAQPAPAAPSNGKWVPLEPTEAMYHAAEKNATRVAVDARRRGSDDTEPGYCSTYRAMLDAAPAAQPADSAMLDWLEEHCTGASDSERYLPFRLYWGKKGHGKSLREVIQDAMKVKP